jgi:hypothetical protein
LVSLILQDFLARVSAAKPPAAGPAVAIRLPSIESAQGRR